MANGLPVSDVVDVTINMASKAAAARNFGVLLILGASDVIDVTERLRSYSSIRDVMADFPQDTPEFKAAQAYYAQTPKPKDIFIGRIGNKESSTVALADCMDRSTSWYGVTLSSPLASKDIIDIGKLIEADSVPRVFGQTLRTDDIPKVSVNDLASQLKALGLTRTFVIYSSSDDVADASLFGRMFSVNFKGSNTAITLKFKRMPTIKPENLTQSQAKALKKKNCNVFVAYENDTAIVQDGVMCDGSYIDERHGLDWLQNYVQTNLFNLLYGSSKVPQTDAGMTRILANLEDSLDQGVANGLIAPGIWNGDSFGGLKSGDMLTKGYYIYAPSVNEQSQADRDARRSPVIQCAIKLAGAVHYIDLILNVNR